jgi:hypothetical protein
MRRKPTSDLTLLTGQRFGVGLAQEAPGMEILRLVGLVVSGAISGIGLIIAVVVLLAIGWLATAIPTVVVTELSVGLIAVSQRWRVAHCRRRKLSTSR